MAHRRPGNFGFPRWGGYGRDSEAVHVRQCDRAGCSARGDRPAPKSPGSRERWYFCQQHAAEYNRGWNFFTGMSEEEAAAYADRERRTANGFRQSGTYAWGGAADEDGLTRGERDAFAVLELEPTADGVEIKSRFRDLAKRYHPDRNPGDEAAARRFQEVRAAYELLRMRGESR